MTILHLSGAKGWRGGEQQLLYLAGELAGMGVKQYFACPDGSEVCKRLMAAGFTDVVTYNGNPAFNPGFSFSLLKLCRQRAVDIIHTHDAHAHTTAFLSAALWGNRTPVVISRRVDFRIGRGFFSMRKYNHNSVRAIICVSEAIRQVMLNDISDKTKLYVVHSGIDEKRFPHHSPTGKLRALLKLSPEVKIIGNTSALAPHKDYFTFADTAALILESRNDLHFVVIGTGPLENEIKQYVLQKGLDAYFTFTGFRNDVPELLPDFDIFLITSKTEGLGTSVLDAFACGVPVVATDAGGIGEMVTDSETGLLAPVGAADLLARKVLTLLADAELKRKITTTATARLNNFTTKNTALKTWEVYRRLVAD